MDTPTLPALGPDSPLTLRLEGAVARLSFNRPHKANALNLASWHALRQAMQWVDDTPQVRVAILQGAGRHFCAGLDLDMFSALTERTRDACEARMREQLRREILDIQDTVNAIERCRKPVIAAIQGACVGGGVDIACACDLRLCSSDAWFSVKEIDIGLVADVGTLQRLPRLLGEGVARELALTGRRMEATEALALRFVSRSLIGREALQQAAGELAAQLAAKSPLALRGTKAMLLYSRDHTVAEGLEQVATWNAALMFSEDLHECARAQREGRPPVFRD